MLVIHANWTDGSLMLWGEHEPGAMPAQPACGDRAHPFACDRDELRELIGSVLGHGSWQGEGQIVLALPSVDGAPMSSPHLAHAVGHLAHLEAFDEAAGAEGGDAATPCMELRTWTVPTVRIAAGEARAALERIEEVGARTESTLVEESASDADEQWDHVVAGAAVQFFAAAARFAHALVTEQRFVPVVESRGEGALSAAWRPWLGDKSAAARVRLLLEALPPAARAAQDAFEHDGLSVLEDFLASVVDAVARRALVAESMGEALEDWDRTRNPEVAWLVGLLDGDHRVEPVQDSPGAMARTIRRWIASLEDRGPGGLWRLLLRLEEPVKAGELADFEPPGDDILWVLSFHLQSVENESIQIDAIDVWSLRTESATVGGCRVESPRELLLKEIGRASRVFAPLERALEDAEPASIELSTQQAYEFLRESRPLLDEEGIGVVVPDWWDSPAARLGARLRLTSLDAAPASSVAPAAAGTAGPARLGLQELVQYEWGVAVGDTPLSLEEFERLAQQRAPLIRMGGKWVEVRPEDVHSAMEFLRENPGGQMRVAEALRLAFRTDPATTGLPILGIDATGWLKDFLAGTTDAQLRLVEPPRGFVGTLRPYQIKGLSWMGFLDDIGLGACLADDMGLGKTIQLLALLARERELALDAKEPDDVMDGHGLAPTLLIVPMSIVGNWKREAARFTPSIRVMVHHGVERLCGEAFLRTVDRSDLIVTTYALAHRDRELLELVSWGRLVLDEAQNIKNPSTKQSQAVRAFDAPKRAVLTGTPVENRLSELWSVMDFCNPGFLGTLGEFQRFFAIPIERHKNRQRNTQLRALVRPFILRRLKTDPTVISDLPDKVETKEYCRLTSEQASLYESCVNDLLNQVDAAQGIKRRGAVLTSLIRLKQICDHPALLPGQSTSSGALRAARSGKCIRLIEMLEEVIASDEQALVFTQFRQMGQLLATMLRHTFDRDILLFHGGTPIGQRERIVETFQRGDGASPVLILSLKAGGVGLNLTAASHVFHFDRWWNPAVENQATDRAFRIGQTRTVNVHKFIVGGTLEDRIDEMIESKTALAEDVIGSGEAWLTELSTAQLRDVLALRPDALADT